MAADAGYAQEFGDQARLAMPPRRRFAILTCTDARLDPARFAGLAEGDAPVIRKAGRLAFPFLNCMRGFQPRCTG